MEIEPGHLYIWSIPTATWRISNGYWLSFFRLFLSFYLFIIFGAIGIMLGEQEGVCNVIYPFGHVMYVGEWSKIPQQRLFGRVLRTTVLGVVSFTFWQSL